ncbi:MAG: hypothetical protein AAF215_03420 [Cyanobacteria bacterium P01_A01_bin.123]
MDLNLNETNARLRSLGIRVTVKEVNKWLYLRLVLPPKPDSIKVKPHRQDVTHPRGGLPATQKGLKKAEKLAQTLWAMVEEGTFDWAPWLGKTSREERTVQEWTDEFRQYWLKSGKCSEKTWKRHWQKAYNRLPQNNPLTAENILSALLTTQENTRERQRTTGYFQRLAEYAGISIDLSPYRGKYQTGRSEVPRELPSDETIAGFFSKIPNPSWRWLYSVIACLGVRPHEAFFLKPTENPLVWNVLDGKTGPRQTSALYPEWVKEWNILEGKPPQLKYLHEDGTPDFQRYGLQVAHQLKMYQLPFVAYDLRHAYAVRCIKFDLTSSIAARMMGHSVAVHTATYHRWLSAAEQQAAYNRAIASGPKAPGVSQEDSEDASESPEC